MNKSPLLRAKFDGRSNSGIYINSIHSLHLTATLCILKANFSIFGECMDNRCQWLSILQRKSSLPHGFLRVFFDLIRFYFLLLINVLLKFCCTYMLH